MHARRDDRIRPRAGHVPAVEDDLAGKRPVEAHHRAPDARLARADEPCESRHLAGSDREACAGDAGGAEPFDPEDFGPAWTLDVRIDCAHDAPGHHGEQFLLRQSCRRHRAEMASVPKHGDPVRDPFESRGSGGRCR